MRIVNSKQAVVTRATLPILTAPLITVTADTMPARRLGLVVALCWVWGATNSCDTFDVFTLCDPSKGSGRVGFYSAGDCLGTDQSVFRGHEWITFLGNRDSDVPNGQYFTDDQISTIIDGNRHTDYPKELLVHLDNGFLEYLDALFAYHNTPSGQAEHFILRSDNSHQEAHAEGLVVLRGLTQEAVALWNDSQESALGRIGKATHSLQDSYSPAHTLRVPDPAAGGQAADPAWCLCKLKTFVARDEGYDTEDIEFHDRLDDERTSGHTTALDSIYVPTKGRECLDPNSPEQVEGCLKAEARQAVVSTHDYLALVRELATTAADEATVDQRLDEYFALHFSFCTLPITLASDAPSNQRGQTCNRP